MSPVSLPHDVAIVGACPAGATCAWYLARQGLRVLLLEKQRFPRDKCGDAVCRRAQVHLERMAVLRAWAEAAGLTLEALANANTYGNFLKDWEPLDEKTIEGIRGLPPAGVDPVLRMLTGGGIALAEAGRAGASLFGHWVARKHAR